MLLTVARNASEAEKLRHYFASHHWFSYIVTKECLVASAEKYQPEVVLLWELPASDLLVKKVNAVREKSESISVITYHCPDASLLSPDFDIYENVSSRQLIFLTYRYRKESPYASAIDENLIVKGMLLTLYDKGIYLYGNPVKFTPGQAFLLRMLAERYPSCVSAEEIGKFCFSFCRHTPRSTVASAISRINHRTVAAIGVPVIRHVCGEGYTIDF